MEIKFDTKRADATVIEAHLEACNAQFVPPLSEHVALTKYSAKLAKYAVLFEAWLNDQLVGLVAGYVNDPKRENSFITNVSVLPNWQGQGLANHLLSAFIDHAREAGFARVVLRVNSRNTLAQRLYSKHGFTVSRCDQDILEMTFNLRTPE